MSLIEQRYPRLAQLMELWLRHRRDDGLPPASALVAQVPAETASATLLLVLEGAHGQRLTIETSGSEVDALYGEQLAGAPVERLAPVRGGAAEEALAAIETARPVTVEDELHVGGCRRRIARMYLPLAADDGSPDGVLCGVVAVR